MLWLSSFIPASLSLVSLLVAIWCYVRVRKLLKSASTRSLGQLSMEVAELTSVYESLNGQLRKLSARVGMRETRHKGEEQREQTQSVATSTIERDKLKEIARARGHKLS